jgi:hypothetical protein
MRFIDRGTAALDNTVELEQADVGWISALPWNQAPAELRERATEQFLSDLIRYQLEPRDDQWRLQFHFDQAAFERLLGRRLGRTVLLTNRMDWTAAGEFVISPATGM